MHSRKSIFYKGFVFILSFFAMAIFSYSNVKAADCSVNFADGNQHLIIGGDHSKFNDNDALVVTGDGCSNVNPISITVNGVPESGTKFSSVSRGAGHYTIGYNYSYTKTGEASPITGTIYRYVRVLNDNFNTSNNYTLANFSQTGSVIESFDIGNNHFANFVVTETDTYVVIKDVLGNDVASALITAGSGNNFIAKKVVKGTDYFYLIGNDKDSDGFLIAYNVAYESGVYTLNPVQTKENVQAVYNSGYYFSDKVYVVGKTEGGNPLVDVYTSQAAFETNHTYTDEKGEFLGVYVTSDGAYVVGYLKADNSNIQSDLFCYFAITTGASLNEVDVLKDPQNTISNTVFRDVVVSNGSLIIVGDTNLVDINANGNYAANQDSRYSDALILKVSTDGTVLQNVKMVGTVNNDTFDSIKEYATGKYVVTGTQNNGNASLVYTLDSEFELNAHLTSGSGAYKVNGFVTWSYGEVYYGKISAGTTSVLDMFYVGTKTTSATPLFVSLDTRTFDDFGKLNLIQNTKYAKCDYEVVYGESGYLSFDCDESLTAPEEGALNYYDYYINTSNLGSTERLNYQIATQTGASIMIYRVIEVTEEPVPVDINNYKTGILRWYVYNRSYSYTNENTTRLESESFNYSSSSTIEEIIREYAFTGMSSSASIRGVANTPQAGEIYQTFNKHNQNSAAFASIEYARQFAYYLEFSRVVRVEDDTVDDVGALRYSNPASGTSIKEGASFYVYYIDYRGNSGSNLVHECEVTPTSVSNCSNKGGYAFASLNDLRIVIEYFLAYNNFFTTTRNTIYNGSIPESKIDAYYQDMYTAEYLKNTKVDGIENLTINVEKNGEVVYSGVNKNVYFGGSLSGGVYTYPNPSKTFEVTKVKSTDVHYQDSTGKNIVFAEDGHYKIYFTYVDDNNEVSAPGKAREFYIDNTAPIIIYDKDSSAVNSTHGEDANIGVSPEKPLFIESSFSIVGLDDLDGYSFVVANGQRYPLTCSNDSPTCLNDVLTHILRRFEYDKNNVKQVLSITFYDRLLNDNVFYFVVGTKSPTIEITNESNDGFTLEIDFNEANPIITSSVLVVSQSCSGVAGGDCYDPALVADKNTDQNPLTTDSVLAFNQALMNYILAVSYRDNELAKKSILTVYAEEGIYTINNIKYIVDSGYFVEVENYGYSITINSDSTFDYGSKKYYYDEVTNSIYTMKVDDEGAGTYVIDESIDSIPLLNNGSYTNVFKFEENGREYRIDLINEKLTVIPIANRYQIVNNKFTMMDGVEYTWNSENKSVSYKNPELGRLKYITLNFVRTIVDSNGVIVSGKGVNIPLTEPVMVNGVHITDSITNQLAYSIVAGKYVHFDLVDGSYTFTITENFTPYSHQVKADINVADLEVDLGVAKENYKDPLQITERTSYSFDLGSDSSTAIALRRLDASDNYPLDPTIIQDSNLTSYKNTYFINRAFYMGIKFGGLSVLIIKIYDELNDYGIPLSAVSCKALVIYGNDYTTNPVTSGDVGCGSDGFNSIQYSSLTNTLLEGYGAKRVVNDDSDEGINSGFFGFNKEFAFYEITLTSFEDRSGTFVEVVNPIVNYLYIDSVGPDDDHDVTVDENGDEVISRYKDTIVPEVYHDLDGTDEDYSFTAIEGVKTLNDIVGANSHVRFHITYNKGLSNDARENKMLFLRINDGTDVPPLCNIYELIDNGTNYETACKAYVSIVNSVKTTDGVILVFSLTGIYNITFSDASNNTTSYSFTIDKDAPFVTVTNAMDKVYNGMELVDSELRIDSINEGKVYYLAGNYTKNPRVWIRLDDLIGAGQYCYKFYSSVYATADYNCYTVDAEFEINGLTMPTELVDLLEEKQFNGDVILYLYSIDNKGNGNESNAVAIHFWVDYKAATAPNIVKTNLNDSVIVNAMNDYQYNTVLVYSSNYSGQIVQCVYNSDLGKYFFAFTDDREEKVYTFNIECQDLHGNETGSDVYSKGFYNNLYMKFYETDDAGNRIVEDELLQTYEIFNFGLTNQQFYEEKGQSNRDADARWIYITIVDSVGNESEHIISLPIFVEDTVIPSVEAAYKESLTVPDDYSVIDKIAYSHEAMEIEGFSYNKEVYIANSTIKLTYSEPIYEVVSCLFVSSADKYTNVEQCSVYPNGTKYKYSTRQTDFIFTNFNDETTRIYVIVVKDFATFSSTPVIVIVDRTTPEIGYQADGEKDAIIQYKSGAYAYEEDYISKGHSTHVYGVDDQEGMGTTVHVSYQRYTPKYTYNNYIKQNNEYKAVANYTRRANGQKYYLLINREVALANNKYCVATTVKSAITYCYVEDSQSYYYFDSLLDDTSDMFWEEVGVINNTTLGVYRITYYAQDFAGNISETIYKKVLVSDTYAPDVNILNDQKVVEYANVTTTNDKGFQGKLNKSVIFRGTDTNNGYDEGVRLVLYKCDTGKYTLEEGKAEKCYIKEQYLYPSVVGVNTNPSRNASTSNEWNLGSKLDDGVYKMFAYDSGGYSNTVFNSSNIYYDITNTGNSISASEIIYSRDYNASYFYFAINIGETGVNYVINGNKYTSDYPSDSMSTAKKGITFSYSKLNYYTITHKSDVDRDVYLVLENADGSYQDISADKAIGKLGFKKSNKNGIIVYTYTDAFERTVYEVTYEPYLVKDGLYLHETYHNVNYDEGTTEVCRIINGVNPCESLETVYKVTSVTANVYEDGVYTLRMRDRYGNLSPEVAPFIVDNIGNYTNRDNNPATGVNYWFSVPSVPVNSENYTYFSKLNTLDSLSNINVLDDDFNGNFNSSFFYAFASKAQAKTYLTNIYSKEIMRVFDLSAGINDVYSLVNTRGIEIRTYKESEWRGENGETITGSPEFASFVSSLIYSTYIGDNSFDDEEIHQVAYSGEEAESSMYEYALLKITKVVTGGVVTKGYELITNGVCEITDSDTQECVKVALRIVNAGSAVKLNIDNNVNAIECRMSNTGSSSSGIGTGCNVTSAVSGATYVFIDSDDVAGQLTRYHANEVYFGIVAYSETAEIEYSELGEFVPLARFEKYKAVNDSVSDPDGRYIWLNSEYVLIDDILNTNLYSKTCTFDGGTYSDCVYVTYISTYTKSFDEEEFKYIYIPAVGGGELYYYNYYDETFYTKEQITTKLNQDLTFSPNGEISSGGAFVPIKTTIEGPITTDLKNANSGIYTNKKVYLELFNETTNSRLFEVKRVSSTEIYSYASLKINGEYININDKVIVNQDGTYRCIIDIPLESSYVIEVMDRAGNKFTIVVSHSDTIPTLDYVLDDETLTSSGAQVNIDTTSSVAAFTKNNIAVYKYDVSKHRYPDPNEENSKYEDSVCMVYLQEMLDNITPVRELDLMFKNVNGRNCSGAYKVVVSDNHGNSNYIEFIFNPYDLTTEYVIDSANNNIHNYEELYQETDQDGSVTYEENVHGTIINRGFKVEIDTEINYMVINMYAPHSNLTLFKNTPVGTVTIKDFNQSANIGSCAVTIVPPNDGKIYSVYINSIAGSHACDGVYTVDIYNRFADDVLNDVNIKNLQGANQEQILSRATYGDSSSVEIDTTVPPTKKLDGNDQYFTLHIDGGEGNLEDTITLLDNKAIEYTNKYITVSWGGILSQSFAYLKYRVNPEDENTPWTEFKDGVTYHHGYTASYEFKITEEGVYRCEFMFVDAVGNEDSTQIFTIIITIEPPKVNLYKVILGDSDNTVIIGNAYEPGTRILDRTILQCEEVVESGIQTRNCEWKDYTYNMSVNGVRFTNYVYADKSGEEESNLNLKDIISRESYWLRGSAVKNALELNITLTVSVKGKDDIKTVLSIIIDQKAPEISFAGTTISSTYTGNVTISISNDDSTNYAHIYQCDVIEGDRCLVYENNILVDNSEAIGEILPGSLTKLLTKEYSGYFMVVAKDDLGNTSRDWFVLDNEAPSINVSTGNSIVAPGMYTNSNSVKVEVIDELSASGSTFEIEFTPLDETDMEEVVYNSLVGLTKEGKYTLTPIDGVNIRGRSITFYIYRQTPAYNIKTNQDDDPHVVNTEATLSWVRSENELVAPIVSVTVNGKMYNAVYNASTKTYTGTTIKDIGEHTFVIEDSAGNRSSTMITINNSRSVCINGIQIEVKMQAYYNVGELNIGKEKGVYYEKNDVIIFALPSQATSGGCVENGLLGYRTLDPENSNYLINDDRTAGLFNHNKYDFVANKFISAEAIAEVNNVGGTVVVFVVTKDIANKELGYKVGTNFFLEDPIGWSMIFVVCLSMVWPAVRIFVKKKVRVI